MHFLCGSLSIPYGHKRRILFDKESGDLRRNEVDTDMRAHIIRSLILKDRSWGYH